MEQGMDLNIGEEEAEHLLERGDIEEGLVSGKMCVAHCGWQTLPAETRTPVW